MEFPFQLDHVDSSPGCFYTPQEAEVIVSSLHSAKDGPALWKFFRECQYLLDPNYSTQILRFGYVFALFSTKQYPMMFKIIKESTFYEKDFAQLAEYWNEGQCLHYMTTNKKTSLYPTLKFRIRKKNPIPESIFEKSLKWGIKLSEKDELLKAYEGPNFYVRQDQAKQLAEKTGLSEKQVHDWYKNRRSRDKRKQKAEFLQKFGNPYAPIPPFDQNPSHSIHY